MDVQITKLSRASWFKIKTKIKVIYIDPGYIGYFETQGIPVSQFTDKADIVLVTHFHKDHLQPKALSMICDNNTVIFSPKLCIEKIGRKSNVVKPGDEVNIDGVKIKVVDAYNTPEGNSTRKVHHKGDFVRYLISIAGITIYHAGDTDFIPEMKKFGKIDIALLPIGGTFVMDINEAVEAVKALNPKIVIPMHQAKADPVEFKNKIEATCKIKVVTLDTGETFKLG